MIYAIEWYKSNQVNSSLGGFLFQLNQTTFLSGETLISNSYFAIVCKGQKDCQNIALCIERINGGTKWDCY